MTASVNRPLLLATIVFAFWLAVTTFTLWVVL